MSGETESLVLEQFAALHARLDGVHPTQRYLSVSQAGAYAGLSVSSVRRLLEKGDLTALRPVRGSIRIDRDELDAFFHSATTTSISGRGKTATPVNRHVT